MSSDPSCWTIDSDLEEALDLGASIWSEFQNSRIFMTGGTGLIGTWLLELLMAADRRFSLNLRVEIMSRNPGVMKKKAPRLAAYPHFKFLPGDILAHPNVSGSYSHFIHAATDASADLNEANPLKMFNTVLEGTRWALEFATRNKIARNIFLSSGAVYGQQPWDVDRIDEAYIGGPNCTDPRAAYAEGKRAAEMLCSIYSKQMGLHVTNARIFAVIGPYLPLDKHFAIGNFIRDNLIGRPIIIKSDGRASRSYLYMADVARWLLTILVRAQAGTAYNVGSDRSVSISELAEMVSGLLGGQGVEVLGRADQGWNPGRYVPSTKRIFEELGLCSSVSLEDSILRTAAWYGWRRTR